VFFFILFPKLNFFETKVTKKFAKNFIFPQFKVKNCVKKCVELDLLERQLKKVLKFFGTWFYLARNVQLNEG